MAIEVTMPQLGESVVEGTVGRWLIGEGEAVEQYQPLLEVETDKVNSEIPAPAGGVLLKILVPEGETVSAGTLLALIGDLEERRAEEETIKPRAEERAEAMQPGGNGLATVRPSGREVITPVVAKIAAEHSINLSQIDIQGSGRGGRITKRDILAYIERVKREEAVPEEAPPWERPGSGELFKPREEVESQLLRRAKAEPAPPQPGEVVSLTPMRRAIADRMLNSLRTSAQATTVMEADLSRVVAYRERHKEDFQRREGVTLSYTPFFIQAVIESLKAVPQANSSFTDEGVLLHQHIHIGVAVALDAGLIVPVIKDADRLSLSGLARAVTDLAGRARAGQIRPDEVRGSTFTLTNHGISGSLFATPIINQPNAGILGVGAIQKRPVVVTVEGVDSIAIKLMCYLSFTFDHRVMDGALADRFLARVVEVLERWKSPD
jgi:2-oxoisovalerate dehydrogenase E2 component (dihydrolipoyl transacylase)